MAAKRYEISGEQWEQIKDMFSKASTGRPLKETSYEKSIEKSEN